MNEHNLKIYCHLLCSGASRKLRPRRETHLSTRATAAKWITRCHPMTTPGIDRSNVLFETLSLARTANEKHPINTDQVLVGMLTPSLSHALAQ